MGDQLSIKHAWSLKFSDLNKCRQRGWWSAWFLTFCKPFLCPKRF